jgi:hypothetical protein
MGQERCESAARAQPGLGGTGDKRVDRLADVTFRAGVQNNAGPSYETPELRKMDVLGRPL